jgi:hypothetical protein
MPCARRVGCRSAFGGGVIGNTAGSGPVIGGSSPPPRATQVAGNAQVGGLDVSPAPRPVDRGTVCRLPSYLLAPWGLWTRRSLENRESPPAGVGRGDGATHPGRLRPRIHLAPLVCPNGHSDVATAHVEAVVVGSAMAPRRRGTPRPMAQRARRRPRSWTARGGGHRRWRIEKTAPSGSLSTAMRPTSARSKGATDTVPPSWPTRLTISSVSATAK